MLLVVTSGVSGCAANYFPLKNAAYFPQKDQKTAILMPFDVNMITMLSYYNTKEILEKKRDAAREYVEGAFKRSFPSADIHMVDYIPFKNVQENELDYHTMTVMGEIFTELNSAKYAIKKNLSDEKGINFDYSIGLKANDVRDIAEGSPDWLIFISVSGVVYNLQALDNTGMNTAAAIMSLGMSKLFPTPDDTIYIEMTVVDAKTGDIIWLDYVSFYGKSLLKDEDIREAASTIVHGFRTSKQI